LNSGRNLTAKMSGSLNEEYCLRWDDFESNMIQSFRSLRDDQDFFDVTLCCDSGQVEAHKVIISASSSFFRTVLKKNPHQHPLLFLRGVDIKELMAVLDFMYHGQVNVSLKDLDSFLAVAEDLGVNGISKNASEEINTKQEPVKRKINQENTVGVDGSPKENDDAHQKGWRNVLFENPNQTIERAAKYIKVANIETLQNSSSLDCIQQSAIRKHDVKGLSNQEIVKIALAPSIDIKKENPDQIAILDDNDESSCGDGNSEYDKGSPMQFDNNPIALHPGPQGVLGIPPKMSMYDQYVTKVIGGKGFACVLCGKTGRDMDNMRGHLEGKHDLSPGYHCHICQQYCKTNASLRSHISARHTHIL